MSTEMTPEAAVRKYFDCYNGHPEDFASCVAPDYQDYGHTPPGVGPDGARADYDHAVAQVGGNVSYVIDALVADGDMVAVAWTGTLPSGASLQGLSLYRATGGLLRSTRHTSIGGPPPAA